LNNSFWGYTLENYVEAAKVMEVDRSDDVPFEKLGDF